jgi:hypothetical protein
MQTCAYESKARRDTKWIDGKVAESESGFELDIGGKTYRLAAQPQCLFQRVKLEPEQIEKIRSGIVFVLGESTELPPERPSRPGDVVIRARACLLLDSRLGRAPAYAALYKNYDPSAPPVKLGAPRKR